MENSPLETQADDTTSSSAEETLFGVGDCQRPMSASGSESLNLKKRPFSDFRQVMECDARKCSVSM